jgi:hypothetical protein
MLMNCCIGQSARHQIVSCLWHIAMRASTISAIIPKQALVLLLLDGKPEIIKAWKRAKL